MIGTANCTYETPCGWCAKWDKKCDEKIGNVHKDPPGKHGAIGICPNCGTTTHITWNPDTDISSCSCGWSNDKPQRGLRVKANIIDESFSPCDECDHKGWSMPQCKECNAANDFKYFERKNTK